MTMMIVGLLIWSLVHLTPSLLPNLKQAWQTKLSPGGYQGTFALLVLLGLILIIFGWRSTLPEHVYFPLGTLKYVALGMIVIGFILMGAANYGSRIKRLIRHPQLTGFALWSIAHLMLNGDNKSVLVFTWLLIWAILEMILINRRESNPVQQAVVSWSFELMALAVSLGLVVVLMWLHPYLSGRHLF